MVFLDKFFAMESEVLLFCMQLHFMHAKKKKTKLHVTMEKVRPADYMGNASII